jgi:hypothetical protein
MHLHITHRPGSFKTSARCKQPHLSRFGPVARASMQEAKPIAEQDRLARIKELEQRAAEAHTEAQRLNKEGNFAGWLPTR